MKLFCSITWIAALTLLALTACDPQVPQPGDPQALGFQWKSYADTDVQFSEFSGGNHSLTARFVPQYPHTYHGPVIAENGTGSFAIGQGDYLAGTDGTKLFVQIGNSYQGFSATLNAGQWHHVALVGQKSGANFTYTLYLNGQALSPEISVSQASLPNGTIRLGQRTNGQTIKGQQAQFYGLIDDVAIFDKALSQSEIQNLASSSHQFTGNEGGLVAALNMDLQANVPATLSRTVQLQGAVERVKIGTSHNGQINQKDFPLPANQQTMVLPFKRGEAWRVIQGYDQAGGSHKGYASFCWDFVLDGHPPQDNYPKGSGGAPFFPAAKGSVVTVNDSKGSGQSPSNIIEIKQDNEEFCGYLHLEKGSAKVNTSSYAHIGDHLGDVGDVGASVGANHLHLAVTDKPDGTAGFVTFPVAFSNYEKKRADGSWELIEKGIPQNGDIIRRPLPADLPYRYTAVWRPSTEPEIQVYGSTYQDYRDKYDALWNDDWRLHLLQTHVINGQVRYSAVWRPGNGGEVQVYGFSYTDFQAKYDELWPQGWRIHSLSNYVINGQVYYSAVWKPGNSGEIQYYGQDYDSYRAKYDELWPQGWRLHILENYVVNGQVRYNAVWRPGNGGEIQVYNWQYADYRTKYDELWSQGWRLHTLNTYRVGNQTRYTAVWKPASGGEIQVYEWKYQDYRVKYDELWPQGWRLELLDVY